jgi:hypothetical protein
MSSELKILQVDATEFADVTEFSMGVFRLTASLEGQVHEVFALHDGTAVPIAPVSNLYSGTHLRTGTSPPAARKKAKVLLPATSSVSGVALVLKGVPLAVPRAATVTLYRYIRGRKDRKYQSGQLQSGTYLTTVLDRGYANSGLAAVGRYALPSAFPPDNVFEYTLAGTTLADIGTVLPNFGEAGGGVEVLLTAVTSVIGAPVRTSLPEF